MKRQPPLWKASSRWLRYGATSSTKLCPAIPSSAIIQRDWLFSQGGLHIQQQHLLQIRSLWLPDPEGLQGRRGKRRLRRPQNLRYLCCDATSGCLKCCDGGVSVFVPVLALSVDGIVAYFKKQVGPASVPLTDEDQLQKFLSNEDASVVGERFISCSFQAWTEDWGLFL